MIWLRKTRRAPGSRRAALVACAVLVAAAFGAINVSGAAALGEQCSGKQSRGLGAFLQTKAQERWASSGESGFNGSPHPLACSGSQGSGGTPEVSFTPLGSPAALHYWGADDGVLHKGEFESVFDHLGTDIAPSGPVSEEGTMLANMKAALASDVVVVPVTQTAIAIAANPPALPAHPACAVPRINAAQLQKVFSGELKNWRQLGAASDPTVGGDCDQAITRIVRDEGAGTTYQFKHYLNSVNPAPLACSGAAKRTWAQLQAQFGGESSPNVEWPRNADCQEGEGPVTIVAGPAAEGEQGPLAYVAANPGTITYGSLPEAQQWAPKQVIDVHNGVKPASPEVKGGGANCGAAKYTLPAGAKAGLNVDWSQVYGSDPSIGEAAKNAYPICTLTWDVAAANSAGLFGNGVATTLHDYLAFVVDKEGGQAAVGNAGYADLPNPVAKAAVAAVAQIGGEGGEEEEEGPEGTVLCKVSPELEGGVLACPKGQGFSGVKVTGSVLPETAATFSSTGGPELTVTCPQGEYFGEFNEDGTSSGNGISSFEFGLKAGCATTFPEEPEAVVSFENPPYEASLFQYLGASAPQGSFTLAKAEGQPLLRIQSSVACVYFPADLQGQVTNGSPTQLLSFGKWLLAEESPGELCPTSLTHQAQLSVTSVAEGKSLYIAGK